ncbi:BZ3500_MvSof-1268-A1-R1_Chr12-1g03647 [Microbotryum saponariae]|uniref:BZ3500_MvSof-1268-A1-R1_Chr12-1g03647 protein n=1 Tax=Microbotryum saponariae TaxID=289078 RepID=A0A2X0LJ83_9BASI|nr:BZ3500_MvSof-1268-A1-R1_Chr12-1g03647 [Microbotryum saponariae]SDA05240.1 BZ3501_MvSof-1269-A2-R1_Chr12-1g03224 [Microbotryum saponariae]
MRSAEQAISALEAPLLLRSAGSRHSRRTATATADHDHDPVYHPRTVTAIVRRIEALTLELLPIQVDLDELTSPVSAILTRQVVEAYSKIAGDFDQCLPFALLEARRYFRQQAYLNPSDSDENEARKLACEALARKLVNRTPMEEQYRLLSSRFTVIEADGDEMAEGAPPSPLSALESAVDQHATFFLSSGESQRTVFALWKGLLVQRISTDGTNVYEPYKPAIEASGFVAHFDPDRVGVPRYQFFFRICLWALFLVCYTIAIQTPDRGFGLEDFVLYIQLLGYLLEDLTKLWKIGWFAALGFWQIVNYGIYTLLAIAFCYRVADTMTHDAHKSEVYRLLSFQFLSSAAPLIWMKLLTIFDLFQYFGTLQIVTFRMLKESAVFFTLLALLAIGFGQALTGLDNTKPDSNASTEAVIHSLVQGLLGSPTFEDYARGADSYPFGMILYYAWSVLTLVILLNILVALFGSAYAECTDEAVPTFLAFFSGKTISAIRAPDQYVYPAPFNCESNSCLDPSLIELLILPLEMILSKEAYKKLNRILMSIVFFIPLCFIALFESTHSSRRSSDYQSLTIEPDEFTSSDEDPSPHSQEDDLGASEPEGMLISKVKFEDLKKELPNLDRSKLDEVLWEVKKLGEEVRKLRAEKDQ